MSITITKAQKKVFSYLAGGIVIIFLFWSLLYLPRRKEIEKYNLQLKDVRAQLSKVKRIEEIQKAISRGHVYAEAIESLQKELSELSKVIDTEGETSLQYISSLARTLNLETLSIKPSPKKLLLDANGNRIRIAGRDCAYIDAGLKLRGGYKELVTYLESLRKKSPSLIVVRSLRIAPQQKNILVADIDLTIYLKAPLDEPR